MGTANPNDPPATATGCDGPVVQVVYDVRNQNNLLVYDYVLLCLPACTIVDQSDTQPAEDCDFYTLVSTIQCTSEYDNPPLALSVTTVDICIPSCGQSSAGSQPSQGSFGACCSNDPCPFVTLTFSGTGTCGFVDGYCLTLTFVECGNPTPDTTTCTWQNLPLGAPGNPISPWFDCGNTGLPVAPPCIGGGGCLNGEVTLTCNSTGPWVLDVSGGCFAGGGFMFEFPQPFSCEPGSLNFTVTAPMTDCCDGSITITLHFPRILLFLFNGSLF